LTVPTPTEPALQFRSSDTQMDAGSTPSSINARAVNLIMISGREDEHSTVVSVKARAREQRRHQSDATAPTGRRTIDRARTTAPAFSHFAMSSKRPTGPARAHPPVRRACPAPSLRAATNSSTAPRSGASPIPPATMTVSIAAAFPVTPQSVPKGSAHANDVADAARTECVGHRTDVTNRMEQRSGVTRRSADRDGDFPDPDGAQHVELTD